MKKKKKRPHRPHLKQKGFQDRNVSSLENHQRKGNTFKSPWSKITGLTVWSSWVNDCIPNILWACILTNVLERDEYLALFRSVIINAKKKVQRCDDKFITHNFLSTLTAEEFDMIFADVFSNEKALSALSALRMVDCLPDRPHWDRNAPGPSPEINWQILARAVSACFNHQSEKATDIRWLKIMFSIISGRTKFGSNLADRVEEYRLYPNKGDMRTVRPSIRAMEMGLRQFEFGDQKLEGVDLPPLHLVKFWAEMKAKTECLFAYEFTPPSPGPSELSAEIAKIFEAAQNHFDETIITTAPDARHDGAFGLVFYSLTLLLNAAASYSHGLVDGRIALRSIVEAFITLQFLAKKDNEALWQQYRHFGSGQAKLAFLKNVREREVPEFFDLKLIEELANEDMWMEFQDIQIGNWANLTLRKMAEEGDVKDLYDKFYDWCSGYAHGHWACVRNTVFVNCMNPLHRFHRIPGPPLSSMPSILPDACKLVNRMLEIISTLYPIFKLRLQWHKR